MAPAIPEQELKNVVAKAGYDVVSVSSEPYEKKGLFTNEKYKGNALRQKVYTVDFLSKKKKVNVGEIQ